MGVQTTLLYWHNAQYLLHSIILKPTSPQSELFQIQAADFNTGDGITYENTFSAEWKGVIG